MNKLYSVHDHWTDIAKKNDVDIESIDGVIAGIKVNGEDFGGGSDFSTAQVTIVNGGLSSNASDIVIIGIDPFDELHTLSISADGVYECVLYKNKLVIYTDAETFVSCEGNASYEIVDVDVKITITGDCTITKKYTEKA